jgi:hypothetical protein
LSLKDRKGRQRKTITVTSNDPKTPRFLLQMVGSVHQEVSLLPRQAVFRYKKGADNPAREVRLRFDTPRPVQITGIVTNEAPCCSVQIKEEVPGKDYKLALKLRPDFDLPGTVQSRSAAIQILTDLPSNPKIRVPIRIQLDRNILVAPTQLTLIEGQDSSSQHLLVRDKRSRKLEVLGLQAPFDGLTYKVNSMSDSMKRLSVLIKNPTQAMNGSVLTLRIKDAEGAERELKVPVRVSGGVITN